MTTILDVSRDEIKKLGIIDVPLLNDKLSSSVGSHVFNKTNLDRYHIVPDNCFYNDGELENFRSHVVLMAPSGFGKTLFFKLWAKDNRGLLSNSDHISSTLRGTFTPESWMGTATMKNNEIQLKPGVFSRFKDGIVAADEFMRFVGMMDSNKVDEYTNEEVYLLSGLDSDSISKDMAYTQVEETGIGTTLWAGSRICSIDMKHGLARRVLFHVFTPTPNLCQEFIKSGEDDARKNPISKYSKDAMSEAILTTAMDIAGIKSFDYTELNKFLQPYKYIPHFERSLLRRMAIGFSTARNTLPNIVMDDELELLLRDEIFTRKLIRGVPETEIIRSSLEEQGEMLGSDIKDFLSNFYQFTEAHIRTVINSTIKRKLVKCVKTSNGKLYSLARGCKKDELMDSVLSGKKRKTIQFNKQINYQIK